MAPLTPELFLSCCISREKVFRGNGVTFREAGGRVRLCKLPSDAIATLQPHLSRKYAWEKKICPRKKCPRRKKVPEMSGKKTTIRCCCPYNHTSAANMKRKLIQFIQKAGFHYFYKHLQSAPKEEGRRFNQYISFVISYTYMRLWANSSYDFRIFSF